MDALQYTIEFLTPFVTITQSTKDFTPFEYFIIEEKSPKIYFINNSLLNSSNTSLDIKQRLYNILERLAINNDYTNNTSKFEQGLKEYQKTLKEFFVRNNLLDKLQSFNWVGSIPKEKPADIKHPPFNYDITTQKYKFYLPGSTLKGIFRSIILQKQENEEMISCLFGQGINNHSQINPRSKLIFEDVPLNSKDLEVYRIIRKNVNSGREDKNGIPNYVMAIRKDTIIKGKIKIAEYKNCLSITQIKGIFNDNSLKNFILNTLYNKAYGQTKDIQIPQKYEVMGSLIYQAGFGSTGLFKTERQKFPKTIYVTEATNEPLGFIKITLN